MAENTKEQEQLKEMEDLQTFLNEMSEDIQKSLEKRKKKELDAETQKLINELEMQPTLQNLSPGINPNKLERELSNIATRLTGFQEAETFLQSPLFCSTRGHNFQMEVFKKKKTKSFFLQK